MSEPSLDSADELNHHRQLIEVDPARLMNVDLRTGITERIVPELVGAEDSAVHLARYRFARQLIRPEDYVLDLGCGVGYGSAELGEAGHYVGCDLSRESLKWGLAKYGAAGVAFLQGHACRLPFKAKTFDSILALEVIEHVHDPEALLEEIACCLKPSGLALLSTPNKFRASGFLPGRPLDPYHQREWTVWGLVRLASRHFKVEAIYGQMWRPFLVGTLLSTANALSFRLGLGQWRVTRWLRRRLIHAMRPVEERQEAFTPDLLRRWRVPTHTLLLLRLPGGVPERQPAIP